MGRGHASEELGESMKRWHHLRWGTVLRAVLFLGLAVGIMGGLFLSVHRRDLTAEVTRKQESQRTQRWDTAIQRWLENGFFHDGGMIFLSREMAQGFYPRAMPAASLIREDSVFPWRNATASWILPAYVAEHIFQAFTGRYSYKLMFIYNLFVVALVAAALGGLAMRLACGLGLSPWHGFLLGCASLVTYQTFPVNLWNFWEAQPLTFTVLGAILLLAFEYGHWNGEKPTVGRQILRSLLALLTIFSEPVTGGLFVGYYLMLRAITEERGARSYDIMALFIVPVAIVALYLTAQELLVRSNYKSVFFVGSTLAFRTGLDGDGTWYRDHWDLLLRGLNVGAVSDLVRWPILFTVSLLFAGVLLSRYQHTPPLREPIKIVIAAIGLYVPFAMAMSQATVIHPYVWDICLVVPCILVSFCLFPAWLQTRVWPNGLPIFGAVIAAGGYAFVQLRTFAFVFPSSP